jgi:hypothetical protein
MAPARMAPWLPTKTDSVSVIRPFAEATVAARVHRRATRLAIAPLHAIAANASGCRERQPARDYHSADQCFVHMFPRTKASRERNRQGDLRVNCYIALSREAHPNYKEETNGYDGERSS